MSEHSDGKEYRVSAAYGTNFGNDRGHFMIGGEFVDNKGVTDQQQRKWGRNGWQVITNPSYTPTNGQYQRLIMPNVHPVNATEGGLITTGVLANTQFLPGGATAPFNLGTNVGTSFMTGGDGIHMGKYVGLSVPVERYNVLARASYELTDTIKVFMEGSFARSQTDNDIVQPHDWGTITIQHDNAFLNPDLQDQMLAAGQTSFHLGRIHTDNGFYRTRFDTKTKRGVIGFEGNLSGWDWQAYYQEGKTNYTALLRNRVNARFANSVDSVLDPVTSLPVCRINADANPNNDDPNCIPVNLFGYGSPSQSAINYYMADQWQTTEVGQRFAEFSVSGTPFATWAGDVNMAFGADYRHERVNTQVDPLSIANAYSIGNPKPIKGSYNVKEVFGEVLIPLVSGATLADSFDINGAIRLTDYSTSGSVTTWKFGATWTVNDSIRFRGTRSRDIRAPNIDELFMSGQLRFSTIIDPASGIQSNISTLAGGNVDLQPEMADTFTAGIVFTPSFVDGLRASIDYYNIKVKDAIGALSAQDIVTRCHAATTSLCDRIERDSAGVIERVILTQLNLNTLKTSGVDIDVNYTLPLDRISDTSTGRLTVGLLASYVHELSTFDGVTSIDRAGDLGNSVGGIPHWKVNANVTYNKDRLTLFTQGRYIGSGKYDSTFAVNGINDNRIPSVFYVDLSGHYNLVEEGPVKVQVFANVTNLFDKDPPVNPENFFASIATAAEHYDVIGRYFSAGVRVKF